MNTSSGLQNKVDNNEMHQNKTKTLSSNHGPTIIKEGRNYTGSKRDSSTTFMSNAKASNAFQSNAPVYNPAPVDILLGRGKPFQSHPGNQWMLEVIDRYRDDYHKAERNEKHLIIQGVLQRIKENRGRFLMRVDYEKYWVEVDPEVSYRKVGHAFRSKGRTLNPRTEEGAKQESTAAVAAAAASFAQQNFSREARQMQSNSETQRKMFAAMSQNPLERLAQMGSQTTSLMNNEQQVIAQQMKMMNMLTGMPQGGRSAFFPRSAAPSLQCNQLSFGGDARLRMMHLQQLARGVEHSNVLNALSAQLQGYQQARFGMATQRTDPVNAFQNTMQSFSPIQEALLRNKRFQEQPSHLPVDPRLMMGSSNRSIAPITSTDNSRVPFSFAPRVVGSPDQSLPGRPDLHPQPKRESKRDSSGKSQEGPKKKSRKAKEAKSL